MVNIESQEHNNTVIAVNKVYAYKAIVALNNYGIQLLARHEYMDAVATLKDAVCLMKTSLFHNLNSILSPHAINNIDQALNNAQARLIKSTSKIYMAAPNNGSDIVVVSDQENPLSLYDMLEENPKLRLCVRIDFIDHSWTCDAEELEIESAILLLNLGMAELCASEKSTDVSTEQRKTMHQSAIHIISMARTIASRLFSNDDDIEEKLVPLQVLLVSLLTVSTLFNLSSEHAGSDAIITRHYSDDLMDLVVALFEQLALITDETTIVVAAAA